MHNNIYSLGMGLRKLEVFFLSFVSSTLSDIVLTLQKEFEDNKGVIRIRTSKKNRQHNGQKKKYKMTNNDIQSKKSLKMPKKYENRK